MDSRLHPLLDRRKARTALQEGISLVPYFGNFQRLHRRRWLGATAVAIVGGLACWGALRLRR